MALFPGKKIMVYIGLKAVYIGLTLRVLGHEKLF